VVAVLVEEDVAEHPEEILVGSIAEPKGQDAALGAIVIGMGVADLQAVRRFAKLGVVAAQIRLIKDSAHHKDVQRRHATYDVTGVSRCRRALDLLASKYGVKRFILMGNCALANICFNTALADPRVAGLVLTNPYVPKSSIGILLKLQRHLSRKKSWARLLTVWMRPSAAPAAFRVGEDSASSPQDNFSKDIVLPADFGARLERLHVERAVRTLMIFSKSEPSLYYCRRFHGKTFDTLVHAGALRFEVTDTEGHDFSARDDSASRLNDIVTDWTRNTWT
jgi:hypothetical protein